MPRVSLLLNLYLNYVQYSHAYLQLFVRVRASYLHILHVYVRLVLHLIGHVPSTLYCHQVRSIFRKILSSCTYDELFTAIMDVAFSSTFYPLSRAPMALQSIVYKPLYHCKKTTTFTIKKIQQTRRISTIQLYRCVRKSQMNVKTST